MWKVQTKCLPVTMGATGTISKSLRKCLSVVPVEHRFKEINKTALLGSAHMLRKLLM
jgi:hypothetical protein